MWCGCLSLSMSISKLAAVARVAVVVATWVAVVPVAEGTFRLLGDEPSADLRGLYAPFADGNYKNAASVDTGASLAAGRLEVHTDGLGLRCDRARRFAVGPGDAIDVLVIGDSQGFGNGVNFEDTIAGSLAQLGADRGVRVANASVGGHSLASQYQLARWLVEEQRVKIGKFIVLATPGMIYGNDDVNHATVGEDGRLYGDAVGPGTMLNLWAKTHLVTYSRVRDAVRNLGIGTDPAKGSPVVFDFYDVSDRSASVEEKMLKGVRRFREFAVAHGAAFELVYVPLTIEADFEAVKAAAQKVGRELDADIPLGIAVAIGQRLSIPVHNLRPVLERTFRAGEPLNVKGDFHYSSTLSRSCGQSLGAALEFRARTLTTGDR